MGIFKIINFLVLIGLIKTETEQNKITRKLHIL